MSDSALVVTESNPDALVVTESDAAALVAEQQVCVLQTVTEQGPAGRPGRDADGVDVFGYQHIQSQPDYTWTIAHNLNKRPSVSTFSVGGVEIQGAAQHLSPDVLVVEFVVPVAGYAHVI